MVEGFHEYFKMKEEMDKAVQEQEIIVEKAKTEQPDRGEENQQRETWEEENRMMPPMAPMGGGMPPRPSMGGGRPPRPNRPRCGIVHVIKEGDTLYKLSQTYKVKVVDLLLANPYVNVYNLQIGDEICVPVKAVPVVDNHVPYIIREEDTLGSVLEKTDLSFEELAEHNPFVKEISLPVNNVMFLPGKEGK